jgi:RNA polymerase sigma-70 factor (ECF subfamily)
MTPSNLHKWALLPDPSPADLARAAGGDSRAFTLIVERYQGMVYSVAYNVLGNHTDAEDAAQEAFLRCYRKLPQYRSEASFSTWLFRLALSAAVDYRRREKSRPEPVEVPDVAGDAAAELGEGFDAAIIVGALADLPEDYRVPTVLRDVYGLPYQEIAEVTGRPLGTVKVMVHRGRASLRLRLRAGGAPLGLGAVRRGSPGRAARPAAPAPGRPGSREDA